MTVCILSLLISLLEKNSGSKTIKALHPQYLAPRSSDWSVALCLGVNCWEEDHTKFPMYSRQHWSKHMGHFKWRRVHIYHPGWKWFLCLQMELHSYIISGVSLILKWNFAQIFVHIRATSVPNLKSFLTIWPELCWISYSGIEHTLWGFSAVNLRLKYMPIIWTILHHLLINMC